MGAAGAYMYSDAPEKKKKRKNHNIDIDSQISIMSRAIYQRSTPLYVGQQFEDFPVFKNAMRLQTTLPPPRTEYATMLLASTPRRGLPSRRVQRFPQ